MAHIAQDSLATIYFTFTWKSSHASHIENYLATNVSFTRDILPVGVKSRMRGLGEGDSVQMTLDPSEVPAFKPGKILDMPIARFQPNELDMRPRIGRYYPKYFIASVPGTRPDSTTPFRVVNVDRGGFKADLNHPMAGREVTMKAKVIKITDKSSGKGVLNRWPDIFFSGPGMQVRLLDSPTDFLGNEPFKREDEAGDADFYANPHRIHHLDSQARHNVQTAYGHLLSDGMDILDLMAGHTSHLPSALTPRSMTGLGLNRREMEDNTALTANVVHNLNEDPKLPFADNSFDAIISTGGIEYLTKPFEIFDEAARVLRPGGMFIVVFSNQWFQPKVVHIWRELLDFERMGLVSQYFIRSGEYEGITTYSDRGWPSPDAEKGEGDTPSSDPIYAVWATKR